MIQIEDNFLMRVDQSNGGGVVINSWGAGKPFANPVEQDAANFMLTNNPQYLTGMPDSPFFMVGAAFEAAGPKVGIDLGNYYTNFIMLLTAMLMDMAGVQYQTYANTTLPSTQRLDAMGDQDCVGGVGISRPILTGDSGMGRVKPNGIGK